MTAPKKRVSSGKRRARELRDPSTWDAIPETIESAMMKASDPERFLREVERRAGATREEMLASVTDERVPNCCDVSEWLRRILGGDK